MSCPNKLNSNNFEIYYVEQTGQYWCDGASVIPTNPVFTRLDTDGGTPITNAEASKSKSLDGTREYTDIRIISEQVSYSMAAKFKYGVHDKFLEYAFQADFVAGTPITAKNVVISAAGKTLTIAGEDLTTDIPVGSLIALPSATGKNKEPMRVTASSFATDSVFTVAPASMDNKLEDETVTTDIRMPNILKVGTSQKWFALLVVHNDIDGPDKYQLVYDCQVNIFSTEAAVNSDMTATFEIFGGYSEAGIPLPTGATLNNFTFYDKMVAADGGVYKGADRMSFVESMSMTLDGGGQQTLELGSVYSTSVDWATAVENDFTINAFMMNWDRQKEMSEEVEGTYYFTAAFKGNGIGITYPTAKVTGIDRTVGEGSIQENLTVSPIAKNGETSMLIMTVSSN